MSRSQILALVFSIAIFIASPVSTMASDRDVPPSLLSLRDRLLKDRSDLLVRRSDISLRIIALRAQILEADRYLSNNPPKLLYEEMSTAKSRMLIAMNDLQRYIEKIEKYLLDNNRDLSTVDYQIQRYACLR